MGNKEKDTEQGDAEIPDSNGGKKELACRDDKDAENEGMQNVQQMFASDIGE